MKHYIRLNDKNEIIAAFSETKEKPLKTDVCFAENNIYLTEETEPRLIELIDADTLNYKYTWVNKTIHEKTRAELWTPEIIEQKRIDGIVRQLARTDENMSRKIDELYAVLIEKGIVNEADFIDQETKKNFFADDMAERKRLRDEI